MARIPSILLASILLASAPNTPPAADGPSPAAFAEANAKDAQKAFRHCFNYLHGWLTHRDPASGLIPRNLTRSWYWNAQDSAADNYPFMVLTCAMLERPMMDTMEEMLRAERRLTNRVGNLPDDYDFATQSFRLEEVDMARLIFGGSEYVKDGILPMTEWMGKSPWSERMIGIMDTIWEHASVETPHGPIPSGGHEVNGEQLQILCRIYWMTGDGKYRDWAFRIADYYFEEHLPTEGERLQLDDHGCEVVGGLSEAYFLASRVDEERHARYKGPMYRMLDRILEVGVNEDGFVYDLVNPKTGEVLRETLSDNWGYNYNAFLTVAMVDDYAPYRAAVQKVLSNTPKYKDYLWENGGADGYADSIEGGLNLLNRVPDEGAFEWLEHSTRIMLGKQRHDGIIEGWHGDGNYARTALMYALWKTKGTYIDPWRQDVAFGAAMDDGALHVTLSAEWPWRGKVFFDVPRHREWLGMPADYPRLNQFPEWFTVERDGIYEVSIGAAEALEISGAALAGGLELALPESGGTLIVVRPRQ